MENTERELHAHHLHRRLGRCGTNAQNIRTNSVSSMSVINTEEYGTTHNCVPKCSYSPTILVHTVDLHLLGALHIICWLMYVIFFSLGRQMPGYSIQLGHGCLLQCSVCSPFLIFQAQLMLSK